MDGEGALRAARLIDVLGSGVKYNVGAPLDTQSVSVLLLVDGVGHPTWR